MLPGAEHAASFPIRDRVLTDNKLYRTGKLHLTECRERSVKADRKPSAKRYLTSVLDCLNTSWAAHFKRAGLP